MKDSSLNDFEKIFWVSSNTFHDDRDNIVIKLFLPRPTKRNEFSKAIRKAMLFFPNLNMRVASKNNGEPYFRGRPKHAKNIVEVEDPQSLHSCFDLGGGEAIRFYYENDNTALIATHHIYFDEESMKSFVDVICDLINNRDCSLNKADLQQIKISDASNAYWKEILNTNCEPCSFFAPEKTDKGAGIIDRILDSATMSGVEAFVANNNISLTAIVIFATAAIIRKILSEDDIIISTPVTLRDYTNDSEIRCGCSINVLPLLVSINPSEVILDSLKKTTVALWSGLEHRNFSFNNLLRELNIDRELGLYNIMAEFIDEDSNKNRFIAIPNNTARLDLSLSLIKRESNYLLHVEYDKSKVTDDYASAISRVFGLILGQITSFPNRKISSLHMCSEAEEKKIIELGKGKSSNCDTDIIGRIIKVAKKSPNKVAVIHNDKTVTYKELLSLSANIRENLCKQKIKKGTIVGIHLNRSIEYIATQLALISIGAPFVPLDITLPRNRIREIAQESNLNLIVASSSTKDNGIKSLGIEDLINGKKKALKAERVEDKDLTYIIFTSGSTGKPKGVMINRLGFTNHQDIMIGYLNLSSISVIAQSAPVSFDISVWQLICPLIVGGMIDIIDKDILIDPQKMLDRISMDKISVLETVPSLINEYLDYELTQNKRVFNNVKVISTGEGIAKKIATKWNERYPKNPLINAYGPAEASDDTHFFELSSRAIANNQDIPIGAPLNNIGTLVLDCDGQICPPKIVGEICIYGISLANGYINNAVKTAESFRYAPRIGENIYATGDYGRWIEYGILGYNGRRDNQIKIRGQRAELGEIEEKIRQILNLEKVSVILHYFGNNKRLVCFIEYPNHIDTEELKSRLSEVLPCYMVPWGIMTINHLPTNNNGKLDRKKLESLCEELNVVNTEKDDRSTGEVVREICDVWESLLGREVKKESDFFALGGDSLLCLTASNELNKRNIYVSLKDIISGRTPVEIAKSLDGNINACCASHAKLPKYSDIQKMYLKLSGEYKNSAEIQAGVYSDERLNNENIVALLKVVQRSIPFLKIDLPNNIISLSNESDIYDVLEKNRKLLNLGKINAVAIPFLHNNTVKVLFIIHHFCFDIYSWEILCNVLSGALEGNIDSTDIKGDECLKIALLNEPHKKIKFRVVNSNKRIKTKRSNLKVHQHLNDIEHIKKTILSLLYDAGVISSDNIIILNERSIRNENIKTINSIGWGTYYEPQEFDYKTSEFYETDETCNVEISDDKPLIVFNIVAENQITNKNLNVIATDIQRSVPFIEIDIVIGQKCPTISIQDNIGIAKNVFAEICSILDENSDTLATPAQRGFLIGSDFGKNHLYREQIAIKVPMAKREEIEKRIVEITQKSKTLRMIFYEKNGEIFQKDSRIDSPIIVSDSCLESEIEERFIDERRRIPDLQKIPPIRYLFVDTLDSLYLCVSYNHVLLDGDSVFFLLDFITGNQKPDDNLHAFLPKAQNQKEAISYWQKELKNVDSDNFRVFKTLQITKYIKEQRIFNKDNIQLIYSLARKHQTTPATIVQSIFNCWALQYFNKDNIGYGFVYSIRDGDVNINNMEPSTNTVPYVSNKKELKDNITATIAKNQEQAKFKEYPLKNILSLSRKSLISFDILLTITTRNLNAQKFNVVYTHEETGFPLAIDFDFSDNKLIMTVATNSGIRTSEIISSFIDFADAVLNGQNSMRKTIYVEGENKSMVFSDVQNLKRLVSKVISTDINNINLDQSFIENGGDSILALRLRNELNKLLFDVSVGTILSSRTLAGLASQIYEIGIEKKVSRDGKKDVIEKILSDYSNGYEANYHEQAAFRLSGSYSSSAMSSACDNIGRYIKSLRTFYRKNSVDSLSKKSRVKYIDAGMTCRGLESAVKAISKYDLEHPFSPEYNELMRIYTINDRDNKNWYLFLSFSTLVTDGWSFSDLLKTLMRLYVIEKTRCSSKQVKKSKLKHRDSKRSTDVNVLRISVDEEVVNSYRNRAKRKITDREVFEECIMHAIEAYDFSKVLRYENNRYETGQNNFNTIGCFARYVEIKTGATHSIDGSSLAYVFENYPKNAEDDLKNGRVQEFNESGNWRLVLLPPKVDYGVFVEKQNNKYVAECYYRKGKLEKRKVAKNILIALRKELKNVKR